MTPLKQSIRNKCADFMASRIDLESFHEWLAPIVWDIEDRNDPDAQELVYSIELAIAEFSAGHRSENELREVMRGQ